MRAIFDCNKQRWNDCECVIKCKRGCDEILDNQTEAYLVGMAENHPDDNLANRAMKILRNKFDKTYGWCNDCDGLVIKKRYCCLNRK